jgi:phosphate/sulfate permease
MGCGRRASGLGQAANDVGKILGPLSLAVIAGTSNALKPTATGAAMLSTFMFLAFCKLAIALVFTFLGHETHGREAVRRRRHAATGSRGHRTRRHSPLA